MGTIKITIFVDHFGSNQRPNFKPISRIFSDKVPIVSEIARDWQPNLQDPFDHWFVFQTSRHLTQIVRRQLLWHFAQSWQFS